MEDPVIYGVRFDCLLKIKAKVIATANLNHRKISQGITKN